MEVPVLNISGQQVQTIDLPADIFEVEVNVGLMHQAYVRQMANARQGNHKTKTRGEVRASKQKIYRQKGTGRARHGSRGAPIFVGGGIAMGPRPRKYTKKMPKKMSRQAIRCALSALLRDEQLVFVDALKMDTPKTREMDTILTNLVGDDSALVLVSSEDENVKLGIRNIERARTLNANYLNIRDLLRFDRVIVSLEALETIQRIWGREPVAQES